MSARSVQMPGQTSGNGSAITVLQVPLQLVSEGLLYGAGTTLPALTNLDSLEMLIVTPANILTHLFIRASIGGDGLATLWEDTTVSATGSSRASLQRNRNFPNAAQTLFYAGPTITADGTKLAEVLLAGGESKNSVGAAASLLEEIILKPSSNYLVRMTNNAGTDQPASFSLTFYEEPQ